MSKDRLTVLFDNIWKKNGLNEDYKKAHLFVGVTEKIFSGFVIKGIKHISNLDKIIISPSDDGELRIALSEKDDRIKSNQMVIFEMGVSKENREQLKPQVNMTSLHICKKHISNEELIKYILRKQIFENYNEYLLNLESDDVWKNAFNEYYKKRKTIEELENEKIGLQEKNNDLKNTIENNKKEVKNIEEEIEEKKRDLSQITSSLNQLSIELSEIKREINENARKYMEENLKDFSIYEGNIDFSGFYNRLCAEYRKEFGDDLFLNSSDIVDYKGVAFQFLMALNTDQIITMCGEPGYGKTTFVSMMAKALGAKLTFVEVQNNWADLTDILGLYNPIDQTYHSTNFLDALLDASTEYETLGENSRIHFICLDEMNLAKVEYYFSFFLSLLPRINRSQNRFPVINLLPKYLLTEIDEIKDRYNGQTEIMTDAEKKVLQLERFKDFRFPPNVRFVATMNVDETTEDLSPKVVDRCVFIEVPGNKREDMNVVTENEDLQLGEKQEYIPAKFFNIGHNDFYSVNDKTELFAKVNFRAQTFINRMFDFFMEYCNGFTEDWFWDYITLCKLLPKCSTIDEYDSIVGENGKYKDLYICAAKKFSDPKCKLSSKEWNYWGKR